MKTIIEEWKGAKYHRDTGVIEDWSHMMEVSNLGNVRYTEEYRSTSRVIKDRPLVRKSGNKHANYQHIAFSSNGKPILRRIHRMVLSSFCPLPIDNEDKMDADHIDFNHTNNELSNLQWLERSEHMKRKSSTCELV